MPTCTCTKHTHKDNFTVSKLIQLNLSNAIAMPKLNVSVVLKSENFGVLKILQCEMLAYQELSNFKKGRIVGMLEAGWSQAAVAKHLGVVRASFKHGGNI